MRAGTKFLGAVLLTGLLATSAAAQQPRGPSDEAVKRLMTYAWAITPPKWTQNDGKVVLIDKEKPELSLIPTEAAKEIIIAAYRSYEAQLCGLTDEAKINFEFMGLKEKAKKQWSDQQLSYIIMLHTATIQYTGGGLEITLKDGETIVSTKKLPERKADECSEDRRKRVRDAIDAYVKKVQAELEAARPPAAAQPTKAAPPAAAPAPKK